MAHAIAQRLGALLGEPVVIDNRAGANGVIASEYVARARPDGHTLMLGYIATHAINPALQKLAYDPLADFDPVGLIGVSPTLLVVNAELPVRDVADLVAQLRERPGRYAYASAGHGTAPHLAAELFGLAAGTRLRGVPFKGSAEAIARTIDGQTQLMFPSLYAASPHVGAGRLRALAVAGPERLPGLPGVPTLREAGIDGVEMTQWYALFAPAGTPPAVVGQLNHALCRVLAEPEVVRRMEDHGAAVRPGTPAQLRELVTSELARWKRVATHAGLTPPDAPRGATPPPLRSAAPREALPAAIPRSASSSFEGHPMRHLPLAAPLLLLGALAAPAWSQSSVTLYGIADLGVRHVRNDGAGSINSLASGNNATSRIGLRGREDLGGGLVAGFNLEAGISADTGSSASASQFFDRAANVGLASRTLGEIRLGRDYVPTYSNWVRFDPFSNVGAAGVGNLISAAPLGPVRSAFGSSPNTLVRSNNALHYLLPAGLGGLEGGLMVAAGEGGTAAAGQHKLYSARIGYAAGAAGRLGGDGAQREQPHPGRALPGRHRRRLVRLRRRAAERCLAAVQVRRREGDARAAGGVGTGRPGPGEAVVAARALARPRRHGRHLVGRRVAARRGLRAQPVEADRALRHRLARRQPRRLDLRGARRAGRPRRGRRLDRRRGRHASLVLSAPAASPRRADAAGAHPPASRRGPHGPVPQPRSGAARERGRRRGSRVRRGKAPGRVRSRRRRQALPRVGPSPACGATGPAGRRRSADQPVSRSVGQFQRPSRPPRL